MTDFLRLILECKEGLKEPEWDGSRANAKGQVRRRTRRVRQMLELLHFCREARSFDARQAEELIRKDVKVTRELLGINQCVSR